ncbi:alpha/beta hydrolase [Candidatus Poriferisodalis sp.]|uniref:alpha/beta hydrolase n=1 Tax=Candidatus Poriferisodalis sp. TaxID=3101277 RepID=UPI003B028E4D
MFAGSEGSIHYERWAPDGPPRCVVVVVHGYAEYAARYGHLAERLMADGAVIYGPDHMGHGHSDGERALITDFEHVVDDLRTLVDIALAEHPGLPVVMIGHSMGGLLTSRFAQENPGDVAGIVLLGAVIGDWNWAREALAQPELPPATTDFSGMSRDEATVEAYSTDPLIYRGRYKRPLLEAEMVALDLFSANVDLLTMPVLFCHGTDDPFVDYRTSLEAVQSMPSDDKTIRLYEGARHELVNETNRDEIIDEITGFVTRVAA